VPTDGRMWGPCGQRLSLLFVSLFDDLTGDILPTTFTCAFGEGMPHAIVATDRQPRLWEVTFVYCHHPHHW